MRLLAGVCSVVRRRMQEPPAIHSDDRPGTCKTTHQGAADRSSKHPLSTRFVIPATGACRKSPRTCLGLELAELNALPQTLSPGLGGKSRLALHPFAHDDISRAARFRLWRQGICRRLCVIFPKETKGKTVCLLMRQGMP